MSVACFAGSADNFRGYLQAFPLTYQGQECGTGKGKGQASGSRSRGSGSSGAEGSGSSSGGAGVEGAGGSGAALLRCDQRGLDAADFKPLTPLQVRCCSAVVHSMTQQGTAGMPAAFIQTGNVHSLLLPALPFICSWTAWRTSRTCCGRGRS